MPRGESKSWEPSPDRGVSFIDESPAAETFEMTDAEWIDLSRRMQTDPRMQGTIVEVQSRMALLREAIQTDAKIQSALNEARQKNGELDFDRAIQLIAENIAFPEQREVICELEKTDKLELQDAVAEKLRSESDQKAEQLVQQAQIDPEIGGNLNQMKTGKKLNIKKAVTYLMTALAIAGSAYFAKLKLTPEPEPKKGYRAGAEVKRVRERIAYKARIQREAREAAEARTEYIKGLQGEAKIKELAKDYTDYSIESIPSIPNIIRQIREGQRTIESLTENALAEILGFKQSIEGDPCQVLNLLNHLAPADKESFVNLTGLINPIEVCNL